MKGNYSYFQGVIPQRAYSQISYSYCFSELPTKIWWFYITPIWLPALVSTRKKQNVHGGI